VTVKFEIHQLDGVNLDAKRSGSELKRYQDALLQAFHDSPEGKDRLEVDPGMGFWAAQMIYYGFSYLSVTVPRMTVADVEEIVTELFPRKVSLSSPDEADAAIPELTAFWTYLKRGYQLPNADAILDFLHKVQPRFNSMMNDPSKFGMAKSFFMLGQSAGFDMTNEEETQKFIALYNSKMLAEHQDREVPYSSRPRSAGGHRKQLKKIRKLQSQSRKKGRKKGR
jgi:hypothetical protein